jgi:hypothetical protein
VERIPQAMLRFSLNFEEILIFLSMGTLVHQPFGLVRHASVGTSFLHAAFRETVMLVTEMQTFKKAV